MKALYAPWRAEYAKSTDAHSGTGNDPKDCVFCNQLREHNDEKYFILGRYEHTSVMFNKYPYNPGHLLIVPFEHVDSLEKLAKPARIECMELANASLLALKKVLNPQGFNVGFNLGKAAGAGIPAHLHLHILPRWIGDTNFLPTLGETKAISSDLVQLYAQLRPLFADIKL